MHDRRDGGAARATQQSQHPRLLRIRSRLLMAGDPAAARLRTDLGCRPRLAGARTFALGHAKLLSRASAPKSRRGRRNSAPPPPKPRGGHGALAGEKSEPVRLGVRDHHTRSLCVQSPSGQSRFWSRSFPQIAEVNSFAMCAIAVLARCLKIDAEKTRVLWLDRDPEQLALRGRGVRDCWIAAHLSTEVGAVLANTEALAERSSAILVFGRIRYGGCDCGRD